MDKEERYVIISPDGFTIHPTDTYSDSEVLNAFRDWKKRYEHQGYYSSVKYGNISLRDLEDYCFVEKINQDE